ncbi:hypothetical protein AUEXF2481DRAFT_335862 [Aureobasidium subglaciale EXF-2481]|uniref:Uncharacterized protein n=1 Tax=Aureobasidium subglaciale (strain EXF-2481) TaxID=1043005 RepID=A0A074Y6H3_AURSE|nr:uncharacterized protein AUEXF2481DRAFT_335862 [Aureobasidium subglaciale EXF-2481]KEQ93300.1 hypothetical protein AUEXF2481DRAFT_335862 [Aureobasidium subglaciale EXF-2481]
MGFGRTMKMIVWCVAIELPLRFPRISSFTSFHVLCTPRGLLFTYLTRMEMGSQELLPYSKCHPPIYHLPILLSSATIKPIHQGVLTRRRRLCAIFLGLVSSGSVNRLSRLVVTLSSGQMSLKPSIS